MRVISLTFSHSRGLRSAFSDVRPILRELFESEIVVARREHPELRNALGRSLLDKEIEPVLPGIYTLRDRSAFVDVRVLALRRSDPDAILMGRVAAMLTFWPELNVNDVQAVVRHERALSRGFRFVRRKLPLELLTETHGIRATAPVLTALDLCLDVGGDGIDEVLRRGEATLEDLQAAIELIRKQPGNDLRRQFLQESSDEPWSAAERLFHRLLRAAGITGWQGNVELHIDGNDYIVDVLFRRERLAIEIDGRRYHGEARFEIDRRRQNALVLDGWRVLRFTWRMLEREPEWVIDTVERALGAKSPSHRVT